MERVKGILEKRKEIYSLLSLLFIGEVPYSFVEDLLSGNFRISGSADIDEGISQMREFVLKREKPEKAIADIEDEYSRLILLSHLIPLTKSEIMGDGEYGKISLEVESRIRKMGYKPSTSSIPPDHISAMFDFMATLIEDSINGMEDLKSSLKKQEEFLEKEIMVWIPDTLMKLETTDGFYSGVAKFTRGFLSLDLNVVKELKLW